MAKERSRLDKVVGVAGAKAWDVVAFVDAVGRLCVAPFLIMRDIAGRALLYTQKGMRAESLALHREEVARHESGHALARFFGDSRLEAIWISPLTVNTTISLGLPAGYVSNEESKVPLGLESSRIVSEARQLIHLEYIYDEKFDTLDDEKLAQRLFEIISGEVAGEIISDWDSMDGSNERLGDDHGKVTRSFRESKLKDHAAELIRGSIERLKVFFSKNKVKKTVEILSATILGEKVMQGKDLHQKLVDVFLQNGISEEDIAEMKAEYRKILTEIKDMIAEIRAD